MCVMFQDNDKGLGEGVWAGGGDRNQRLQFSALQLSCKECTTKEQMFVSIRSRVVCAPHTHTHIF